MSCIDVQSRAMAADANRQPEPHPPLHRPAMVPQVLELLAPRPGDRALDVTLGTGGHSLALADKIGPEGLLVGADADPAALETARERLRRAPCPVKLLHARFSELPAALDAEGVTSFDRVLADLGVGSHQLDEPGRGFSFESDRPLDMRYDPTRGRSAREVVNTASERELAEIFHRLGEERYSRRIAERICEHRQESPIETPAELSELVKQVYARRTPRGRTWRIHPATRVMMALRIYVNDELEELDALLRLLPHLLESGGRAAVLTYHSLEARRVKRAWRAQREEGRIEVLTDSPLTPTEQQIAENPRVRSAQLRACEKV